MAVANVVAMNVADEHDVDATEPRIVRANHGAPGVIEQACAVGILEDESAVETAELTHMTAKRRDLHRLDLSDGDTAQRQT